MLSKITKRKARLSDLKRNKENVHSVGCMEVLQVGFKFGAKALDSWAFPPLTYYAFLPLHSLHIESMNASNSLRRGRCCEVYIIYTSFKMLSSLSRVNIISAIMADDSFHTKGGIIGSLKMANIRTYCLETSSPIFEKKKIHERLPAFTLGFLSLTLKNKEKKESL